jgi:hypothetical protein
MVYILLTLYIFINNRFIKGHKVRAFPAINIKKENKTGG